MKQVLIFKTGEITCSESPAYPGSMCPFVVTSNFGTKFYCQLFGNRLKDVDGWLQRTTQCISDFKGSHEITEIGRKD